MSWFYSIPSTIILKIKHWQSFEVRQVTDILRNLPPVFSGVRVTRSLVLYVCFVDRCLYFCTFSFGHCVVCSSSIYDSDSTLILYGRHLGMHPVSLNTAPSKEASFRYRGIS